MRSLLAFALTLAAAGVCAQPRLPAEVADTIRGIVGTGDVRYFDSAVVLATAAPGGSAAPPQGAAATPGPPFDCGKAANAVEKMVCGDPELAALDRALAEAYAKGLAPASDRTATASNASRAAQREWIAERNACAKQKEVRDCVLSSYQRRLIALRIRNGELPIPKLVGYLCAGLVGQPVSVAYYRETDPPSAVITVGDRQSTAFLTRTASGAKYAAKGVELWEHHGEATLRWSGKEYVCKAV